MSTLIERLRSVGKDYDFHENALIFEAADEIDRLQRENEELRNRHKELREANLYLNERLREAIKELHPLKGMQELAALKRENEELHQKLKGAANYIDFLGGDSKAYRQRLSELAALKSQSTEQPVFMVQNPDDAAWSDVDEATFRSYGAELTRVLYTTPTTATALVEDFKRRCVEVCMSIFSAPWHDGNGFHKNRSAAKDCAEDIESLPLIEGE